MGNFLVISSTIVQEFPYDVRRFLKALVHVFVHHDPFPRDAKYQIPLHRMGSMAHDHPCSCSVLFVQEAEVRKVVRQVKQKEAIRNTCPFQVSQHTRTHIHMRRP
jgi:hypothetical protein